MATNSNTIGYGNDETNASIPTIIAASALGYLKANTVMAQLVARNWDSDLAQKGQTVNIPFRGALSFNAKATDAAVTKQVPDDSAVSVTLNQHNEVTFLVEDVAEMFTSWNLEQGYSIDGIAVLAEEIDSDLTALYSGLSQSIDASGGLGEDDFRLARRMLNTAKAPLSDRFFVLHEDAEYELLAIEKFVNQDYRQGLAAVPEGLVGAFAGRFAGFGVFMDQKIKTATTHKNLAFHRNAFVLATRPLRIASPGKGVIQTSMAEDGVGIRVSMSYDTDYLANKVTIDLLYGVAELRDTFGITVSTTDL